MAIEIVMPALSPTMTEGGLVAWLKKVGERVEVGEIIAEIETDKSVVELEAIDAGVLGEILIAAGTEEVPVDTPIAVLLEDGENVNRVVASNRSDHNGPGSETSQAGSPNSELATESDLASKQARVFISPAARQAAKKAGIEIGSIVGTGPRGRIGLSDVKIAVENAEGVSAAGGAGFDIAPFSEVPHTKMRKTIARRLSDSKRDIPHFYVSAECSIDDLLAARSKLNSSMGPGSTAAKLSVTDLLVKAIASALKIVPEANSSWTDDGMRVYSNIDVAVAVSTSSGLITPVIRKASTKSVAEISNELRSLVERAREGTLSPAEYEGGSITVSNLGMYGVQEFSAIINPPQSCILAIGAGVPRPVVADGEITIATVLTATLSVDHRSVDGVVAAQLISAFKDIVENPAAKLSA